MKGEHGLRAADGVGCRTDAEVGLRSLREWTTCWVP